MVVRDDRVFEADRGASLASGGGVSENFRNFPIFRGSTLQNPAQPPARPGVMKKSPRNHRKSVAGAAKCSTWNIASHWQRHLSATAAPYARTRAPPMFHMEHFAAAH